jgi:hypothetical protein
MKPPSELIVQPSAHALAAQQARAFAGLARSVAVEAGQESNSGMLLAYLTNASFATELYFKALMICGRSGRITTGHDLQNLYNSLPQFLRSHLNQTYKQLHASTPRIAAFIALKASPHPPTPPVIPVTIPLLNTFGAAAGSLKDTFIKARYFFENINDSDWAIFLYAPNEMNSLMGALDTTYEAYLANAFVGQDPMAPMQHDA